MSEFEGRDPYLEWDAAYVLGALPTAERLEFEEHKAHCLRCANAVADLAGMPQLLSIASVPDVGGVDRAEGVDSQAGNRLPGSVMTAVLGIARRRRQRRFVAGATALVAAVTVAVLVGVALLPGHRSAQAIAVPLTPVRPSGAHATVYLAAEPWGTRIDVSCSYDEHGAPSPEVRPYAAAQSYQLLVTDRTGMTTVAAQWKAGPGATVWPIASLGLGVNDIAKIAISTGENVALLQATR